MCGQEVKIVPFGKGWVACCCNEIIYNKPLPPAAALPPFQRIEAGPILDKLRGVSLERAPELAQGKK